MAKVLVSAIVSFCISASTILVFPQDLVASDDVSGGASVFVFRKSRKEPQEKSAGRSARSGGGRAAVSKNRYTPQVAANRQKRVTKAKQTTVAANRTPQRNSKVSLANTLVARADASLDKGEVDKAIVDYREALKAVPAHANAKAGLSEALTAKGIESAGDTANTAAVPFLTEAITLDPANDVAYAKLGEVYDANNDPAKALTNYEKALQLNAELASLYVPVGMNYVNAGEIVKAETAAQNAEKRGVSDASLHNLKGMIFYKQNKNTDALAAFEKALSLEGRNATAKYYRAALLDRMNQPEQSIAAYRETVALEPAYSPAWYDMGVAYYNKGDYKNAAMAYGEAVKVDPSYHQAHYNLANTYRQLEQWPQANSEYGLAEVGIKDNADLYSEWGYALGKVGDWNGAIAKLEQARKLSPNAVDDSNAGWGYYNGAQNDKQNKKDAEANAKLTKGRDSLNTAVQKDPKLDAAYMNLGSTNNSLGDHEAAVKALNTALSLHNDWVIALNQLGLGYRGLNNLSMAVTQFNRVVSLDGNNVAGLFNLGSAQFASGDKKGAQKTQARLKKLNPGLATQLDGILSGKAVVDEAKRKIESKVPKVPRIPF
ncbi:MAG TPA: tetratricopeptide repeat protein [Pyrinomonadaceae bacterium]|nr:tetratricopeptide repeat protein [Pyrinomonadaceae bacterium]